MQVHTLESFSISPKNTCSWTDPLTLFPAPIWQIRKTKQWLCIYVKYPKGDQSWVFIGRTDAEGETPILWPPHTHLSNELTHWKRPWCWERLGAGGEGDDRGWDSWMASLTWWAWVWVNCGSWWWTGRPGVLRFMGSQRVRHDWATDLNWNELKQWLPKVRKT